MGINMDTNTDISIHTGIPSDRSAPLPDCTLDYHAHILPGCDHGSSGLDISLKQVAMAKAAGIRTICATPHFYPQKENAMSFLARRAKTYQLLRENLSEEDPSVLPGAEVLICAGMERMEELRSLCLLGTNELLLEMPFYRWPKAIWDTVFLLHERDDIRIVIAHADRYPPEDIERLIMEGIWLQLNADSLLKPLRRKRYLTWIKDGYVKCLGSDIHGADIGYRDWEKCRKLLKKRL